VETGRSNMEGGRAKRGWRGGGRGGPRFLWGPLESEKSKEEKKRAAETRNGRGQDVRHPRTCERPTKECRSVRIVPAGLRTSPLRAIGDRQKKKEKKSGGGTRFATEFTTRKTFPGETQFVRQKTLKVKWRLTTKHYKKKKDGGWGKGN